MKEHVTERLPADPARGPSAPARGVTRPSMPGGLGRFVSDVIVELGFVDATTVERAVETARVTGKSVTSLLLENGALTEEQLARAIAERHGLDYLDLDELEVDLAAVNLVRPSDALRYSAVPVGFTDDGALVAAMADPADPLAIGELSVMTKLEIRPAVATPAGIEALLERLQAGHDGPDGSRPPLHQSPESAPTANGAQRTDPPGGAVVWPGQRTDSADRPKPVAAAPVEAPPEPSSSVGESATAEPHNPLSGAASEQRSMEAITQQLEHAQRETRQLRKRLRARDEEVARARGERDRLAAERENAAEEATVGERAERGVERLIQELESERARASSAAEELEAALEEERSQRSAGREAHELEATRLRAELERSEAAARSSQAESERLGGELDAARARAEETERKAQVAQGAADEARRAAEEQEERASSAAEELEAALEEERSQRAADREGHELEASKMRAELESAQAAARSGQAESARLASDLDTARARTEEAERKAQETQEAADERRWAAEEAAARAAELEEADERAERARLALADLREAREREGELFARTERELREEVSAQREALQRQAGMLRAARGALGESIRSMSALEADLADAGGDPQPRGTHGAPGSPGESS
jgi:Type II secretion system (T2SS), protein E, N-terminal domain